MPKRSETGNVKKRCACGRAKWSACPHPWHVDFKVPKGHQTRASQRYRRNLDAIIGFHPTSLFDAKREAQRAFDAWLDGRDPGELQPPIDRRSRSCSLNIAAARTPARLRPSK